MASDEAAGAKRQPQQHNTTTSIVTTALSAAPSASVANSSSASGTGPVSRTRTRGSAANPVSRTASRIAATARAPGCSAPKSSTGCTRMKRRSSRGSGARPMISVRHEKRGTCPALIAFDRVGERGERPREVVELDLFAAHAFQHERQRIHHPAQRRIGRQRSEQRLRRDHLLRRARDFFRRREQQSRAIEERTAVGPPQRNECRRIAGEPLRQRGRRLLGQFGRRAVDDDGDHGDALRKRLREVDLALAPRQIRRDQRWRCWCRWRCAARRRRTRSRPVPRRRQHEPRARCAIADHARDQRSQSSTPLRACGCSAYAGATSARSVRAACRRSRNEA